MNSSDRSVEEWVLSGLSHLNHVRVLPSKLVGKIMKMVALLTLLHNAINWLKCIMWPIESLALE